MLSDNAKKRGIEAVKTLLRRNNDLIGDGKQLIDGVVKGESFAEYVLRELGAGTGRRYLAEEFAEHMILAKRRPRFDEMSLPEVLLGEDLTTQPWHAVHTRGPAICWNAEAAEPWHPSLRIEVGEGSKAPLYAPLESVSEWFNAHPSYFELSVRILTTVYKGEPKRPIRLG